MTTPFSRDMDTLTEDGPQATQFEAPTARQMEAPGLVNATGDTAGQAAAEAQRPQFSPVGQPGMIEEIHWHEVRSPPEQPDQAPASTGMIGRFHPGGQPRVIVIGGRRKRRGRGKRPGPPQG